MSKLNKTGLATIEILSVLLIPGALTLFFVYKIASKVPILNRLILPKQI